MDELVVVVDKIYTENWLD